MSYCSFGYLLLGEAVASRVVVHPEDAPGAWMNRLEVRKRPSAGGGVYSTARDMAVFGQMFLGRGTYGGTRILSPAAVVEMTRNQIPGIGARYEDFYFPEASWGLGWGTRENKNNLAYAETLHSQRAFAHCGDGGVFMWVDPAYDLVGIYFSVWPADAAWHFSWDMLRGRPDMFVNAVTAAIIDT